tara:strand:- start:28512 stop:29216 length:705 start_codon:yes stop_codon:yes gene_type:complete
MSFISIENISKTYTGASNRALDNISLTIEKNSCNAVLGASGCGKTTLLRIVAGLETPDSGSLRINDTILSDDSVFVSPSMRGVGMVFQNYALFPHMTVENNILFGLDKSNKTRLEEMLELTELVNFKKRYPHELSGGQQQRVALARALAPAPEVLLLDEPFSNLDYHLKSDVRSSLKSILDKTGVCSILVTHSPEDALAMADNVIVLNSGIVLSSGTVDELKNSKVELLRKVFG